ncbi:MAG: hypothetical protein KC636_17535, partial [Myxococcales bacterium]|nr:hypothetical protein [Myxococcales bacterium]
MRAEIRNILRNLSPGIWTVSLFDCQQLTAAVGEPSVIDALRLAALEGPPRPLAELAVVGMTDYGPVALTSAGELLAPTRARAPSGGLDLESLLRREADAAAHDFEDGLIFARLPDSAPILASVRVAGPRARVDVTYSHAPHPLAQRLLSALGIRCVSADDSGRRARYEVDLREHL